MQKSISSWVKATLIILFVLFIVAFVILQIQLNELKNDKILLQEKVDEQTDKIDELQNALNSEFNEEYIIKIARERLNLRLPEEIIFYNDLLK